MRRASCCSKTRKPLHVFLQTTSGSSHLTKEWFYISFQNVLIFNLKILLVSSPVFLCSAIQFFYAISNSILWIFPINFVNLKQIILQSDISCSNILQIRSKIKRWKGIPTVFRLSKLTCVETNENGVDLTDRELIQFLF